MDEEAMPVTRATVLLIVIMILTIVAVDITLLRHAFWPRLATNIGIVLICGTIYVRFIARS